jgi:hypothetical protein
MAGYKALFVGEQKVKKTAWKSRADAVKRIVNDGLSVVAIYETEDGKHYFDCSADIAELLNVGSGPDNVRKFVERCLRVRQS